jgi:hypothetical protein
MNTKVFIFILTCLFIICTPVCAGKGDKINLNEHTFLIDGTLTDDELKDRPFVFNDFKEAMKHLLLPLLLAQAPF